MYADERAELALLRDAAVTLDGIDIVLHANIGLPEEASLSLACGAHGIGLFRSEFLFMGRPDLPGEEEQYEAYASVVKVMAGRPVTIRTLDIGADKMLDDEATVATNPALGQRAIRYCLARPRCSPRSCAPSCGLRPWPGTGIDSDDRAHARGTRHLRRAGVRPPRARCARPALCGARRGGGPGRNPAIAIAIEPFVQALDFRPSAPTT